MSHRKECSHFGHDGAESLGIETASYLCSRVQKTNLNGGIEWPVLTLEENIFSLVFVNFLCGFDHWYYPLAEIHKLIKYILMKFRSHCRSPGLVVKGRRLMFKRSWVRIPALYIGWTFFRTYLL